MKRIISWVFAKVPAGYFKDLVREIFYNNVVNNDFSLHLKGKIWQMRYHDFSLNFGRRLFPYHVLRTNYLFLHHFPKEKVDILVDAGAYIGTFILYVKKRYPQVGTILAFEPDPANKSCLEENLHLNGLLDAEVRDIGLWNKEETLTFYINQKLASSLVPGVNNSSKIHIKVNSLDSMLKDISGKRIFIKMNIEGAELQALEGCRELICKNKVHLAIAADHIVDDKLTVTEVEQICRSMKLSVSTFRAGRLITVYASNEYSYTNPVTF